MSRRPGLHPTYGSSSGGGGGGADETYPVTAATGDGTTNDATVIQAEVDALSTAGGGTLFFPPGDYALTAALVPKNNVTWLGSGEGVTNFKPVGIVSGFLRQASSGSPITNAHFRDFTVDGEDQTLDGGVYNVATKGFYTQYHINCSWVNVTVKNTHATGFGSDHFKDSFYTNCTADACGRLNTGGPGGNGFGLGSGAFSGGEGCIVTACVAKNNARYGIMTEYQTGTRATGYIVAGCLSYGNEIGIADCGNDGMLIEGNLCWGNSENGIASTLGTNSTQPGINGVIRNNIVWDNDEHGIYLQVNTSQAGTYTCSDNEVYLSGLCGIRVSGYSTSDGVAHSITGNRCHDNQRQGIHVNELSADHPMKGFNVSFNECWNNGLVSGTTNSEGIYLEVGDFDGLRVVGNHCFDVQGTKTQTYGLRIGTGVEAAGILIENNDLHDHLTANALIEGTLTGIVRNNAGYDPVGVAGITVGASPYTYTAGMAPEMVYIDGGTVSLIVKSGTTLHTSTGKSVRLEPNQSVVVTYSSLPTMTKDRL